MSIQTYTHTYIHTYTQTHTQNELFTSIYTSRPSQQEANHAFCEKEISEFTEN